MKQAIIVRKDLKMGCGKIAGQVAHASVRALLQADWLRKTLWFREGEAKIVLKVQSEEELLDLEKRCAEGGLKCARVHDAGRTQIEANTFTALGIGPYKDEDIDWVTGELKLL